MKSWIKEIFWEDFKEEVIFIIKNFKKIIKRTWEESISDLKNQL